MPHGKKILLVDDNVELVRVVGLILHNAGYEVKAVTSGRAALEKLASFMPDLLLVDVMMPDMSGLELLQQVRANPKTNRLPAIILSALAQVDDKVSGFRAGADDYMTKPVEPKELLARVEALLLRASYSTRPLRGQIIGLVAAKGGVGTSTVALNMAVALAQEQYSVTLIELRPDWGTLRFHLQVEAGPTLGDLLDLDAGSINPEQLGLRLVSAKSGARLLFAPAEVKDYSLEPGQVAALAEAAVANTNFVLLDMPPLSRPAMRQAIERAAQVLLVTEAEPISLASARAQAALLKSWRGSEQVQVVVVNRSRSASLLGTAELEAQLGLPVIRSIPPAPEAMQEAARNGVPLVQARPELPASQALAGLAHWLTTVAPVP